MCIVEVVYATKNKQSILEIKLEESSTVKDAIYSAKILELYPEIKLTECKVSIFEKICSLDTQVKDGDRVVIHRPLVIDPKEARRLRALKNKKKEEKNKKDKNN